jgi:hypothetical protein
MNLRHLMISFVPQGDVKLQRLSKNRLPRGGWKMSICKLSFAKSRSVVDPARGTGASEIPRNEAYIEVRRSDQG